MYLSLCVVASGLVAGLLVLLGRSINVVTRATAERREATEAALRAANAVALALPDTARRDDPAMILPIRRY